MFPAARRQSVAGGVIFLAVDCVMTDDAFSRRASRRVTDRRPDRHRGNSIYGAIMTCAVKRRLRHVGAVLRIDRHRRANKTKTLIRRHTLPGNTSFIFGFTHRDRLQVILHCIVRDYVYLLI